MGGLVAGNALLGSPLPREALLRLAAQAEGHPDNVAAALLGGLTVSCGTDHGALAVALPVPASLRWIALVPDLSSSTADARAVLPPSVPRADAVFNVQRVALLLAALQAGQVDLLATALDDRLHQPYRERLFPWMIEVMAAARAAGALGCVLSGAGPSLLAVVTRGASEVARAMEAALTEAGLGGAASGARRRCHRRDRSGRRRRLSPLPGQPSPCRRTPRALSGACVGWQAHLTGYADRC